MLSHLRFHRRGPSNPSSPNPDQSPSPKDYSPLQPHPPFSQDAASSSDGRPQSASASLQPPTLPPITRVTFNEESTFDLPSFDTPMNSETQVPRQPPRSPYTEGSGFMGGVALQKYRREQQLLQEQQQQQQQQQIPGRQGDSGLLNPQQTGAESQTAAPTLTSPSNQSRPSLSPATLAPGPSPSFTSPIDLPSPSYGQHQPQKTGRRPPGVRLATDPSPLPATVHPLEPPKGRKGLPFLKNPMSTLLARRKTSQNAPDIAPLPLKNPEPPSYDPRIRGTRVHDFSAPRVRKPVPSPLPDQAEADEKAFTKTVSRDTLDPSHIAQQGRNKSNASDSGQSSTFGTGSQSLPRAGSASSGQTRHSDLDRKPLPGEPPNVPPKDDAPQAGVTDTTTPPVEAAKSTASTTPPKKANMSRNASLAGSIASRDVLSSIPRHMKSTSSRFSFDMIGAAKQEKLLEERHRQRALERGTASPEPEPDPHRDSRFDDFDEDAFDYDAMLEDDGLEEPIPGAGYDDDYEEDIPMNSMDYDEEFEEDPADTIQGLRLSSGPETARDPDDDQNNFAGFVFQRSNPASELPTPRSAGLLVTPRDADGKEIGFATSGDTPDLRNSDTHQLAQDFTPQVQSEEDIAGLGIQGLDVNSSPPPTGRESSQAQPVDIPSPVPQPSRPQDDELYFEGGLLDANEFAGQGDGSTFDESLFDLDDTDQYGRPIPGAFAAAQAARLAAQEESKRASDTTSRLSGHSEVSQSTAHTSFSGGPQLFPSAIGTKRESEVLSGEDRMGSGLPASSAPELDTMAAYQAALAAAALRAEADGKFRRGSSTSFDAVPQSRDNSDSFSQFDGYDDSIHDDSFGYEDMDDYDVDDDAIIAEANADALASDSNGWYGSEFGFYSSPAPQPRHSRDNSNDSDKAFEYANGGFFGPSGVSRTKSGRVVSREPNLTPITERSEYSNRNSIMSLAVPPIGSGASSLASPGLAQLAMMSDDGDMSLTALMRLRSRAWGGSQISLSSSREGSPRSERADGASSPWSDRPNFLGPHGHARKSSAFSVRSREFDSSEPGSTSGSPTLTMSVPAVSSPPPPLPPLNPARMSNMPASLHPQAQPHHFESIQEAESTSGVGSNIMSSPGGWARSPDAMSHPNMATSPSLSRRPGMGHKHKTSADSISYTQEEERGETRWVMERRYTAETGEIEIEREILQQGRI